MVIGLCTIDLHLPGANSLKDKRSVLKSVMRRIRNEFNVSIAEVDHQDLWRSAVLGAVKRPAPLIVPAPLVTAQVKLGCVVITAPN